MVAQEITHTIKCPVCQWQITMYLADFQGKLRLQCSRCNRNVFELGARTPKDKMALETTLAKEVAFPKESASIARATIDKDTMTKLMPPPSPNPSPIKEIGMPLPNESFKRVGEYNLLRLIGAGAMGQIYLGEFLGKPVEGKAIPHLVAIKVLSERIQTDIAARDRFLQEAQVHSRLCRDSMHPNIVQIYDVGYCTKSGRLYLVMEYIEGESLEKRLTKDGKLAERHSLQIAIGVAHALEHAFKHRIIHRDLKPANILIDMKSRKAKVADLGLGKILEEKGVTVNGEFMGTPYYMAPEQVRNAKDVDQQADLYALGATLYHMVTGRPPYGEYKRTLDILRAKMSQEPNQVKEYAPATSDAVVAIIEKAMARDKKRRYGTPTDIIDDMQRYLEGKS